MEHRQPQRALFLLISILGVMMLTSACTDPDFCNPLGVGRYESGALAAYTLITNGYQTRGPNQPSTVVLLNNDTQEPLWTYTADDIGELRLAHSAVLNGDEMLITDTNHDRVIIVEAANGMVTATPDFQLVWSSDDYANLGLDYPNDAHFLANGNLLITDHNTHRLIEVDRNTGEIEWQFGVAGQAGNDATHLNGPHNADRLANGRTIVSDSNNNRILEIGAGGNILWQYAPTGADRLAWPRDADVLANGNVLIADSRNGRVLEVTRTGAIVWEWAINVIATQSEPYEADLLANGNILVPLVGATSATGKVLELDYETQEVLWSFPPPTAVD